MATSVPITVAAWRVAVPSSIPRRDAGGLQLLSDHVRRELVDAFR